MIPQGGLEPNVEETDEPSHTYKLHMQDGRVVGYADGLEAIRQSVFKILKTPRYAHEIYDDDYGFDDLIGVDRGTLESELPQRVEEALLQDDRITAVMDFVFDFDEDKAHVSFTVESVYGNFRYSREVSS